MLLIIWVESMMIFFLFRLISKLWNWFCFLGLSFVVGLLMIIRLGLFNNV